MCLEDRSVEVVKDHLLDYYETKSLKSVSKTFTKHLVEKSATEGGEMKVREQLPDTSDVWYMEDPFTKGLVKHVEIDMEPGEGYNFIIVLKSKIQNAKPTLNLANIVITTHAIPDQSLKVFCFGAMEIPQMFCPKEIYNKDLGYSCLKVMMKRNASFTPIKVLLANNGDIPVDAQFLNADWGGQDKIVKLSIPREKVSIDA